MRLSGWGRFPIVECQTAFCRQTHSSDQWFDHGGTVIARGNGRAYGDAALNPDLTLSMLRLDRLSSFDVESGILTCEAGVLLSDILQSFVPRGWFSAIVPGTKYVTVGGMIASDVHGKNHHHDGTFGGHVESFLLAKSNGEIERVTRTSNPQLFRATLGGMGLTGVILSASFRMIPIETAYVREETVVAADLDEVMALFEESRHWRYSVAWIDCLARGKRLGRSLLSRGQHLSVHDLPGQLRGDPLIAHQSGGWRIPFDAPAWLLNGTTVKSFNSLYYGLGKRSAGERIVHYDKFFFPLDRLLEWNRLYGRRGFAQYQCVLPKSESAAGLTALLNRISRAESGSFLAVLKLLGEEGEGLLSFPMDGYTLALDFPLQRGAMALLEDLDRITLAHGGRIYLAKDARIAREHFHEGYRSLPDFIRFRRDSGASGRFSSTMSERLAL